MEIARHSDKIILSLILCLAILFFSVVAPLQNANAIAIVDDAIIAIIVAGLAAVGITFVTSGGFENTVQVVRALLEEWCSDNNTTVYDTFRDCQAGSNKLGKLLINNRFVIVIDTFARWLIAKYNAGNNEYIEVQNTNPSINGLELYNLPYTFVEYRGNTPYRYEMYSVTGESYVLLYNLADDYPYGYPMAIGSEPFTIHWVTVYSNGTTYQEDIQATFDNSLQVYKTPTGSIAKANVPSWSGKEFYTIAELQSYLPGDIVPGYDDSVGINTGVIDLPLDSEDYEDGYGGIIDTGAAWGMTYDDVTDNVIPNDYSESKEGTASIEYVNEEEVTEQVEETQETTNLPAGTIPYGPDQLPEFNLPSIWHYVAQWIADVAVAMGSVISVMTMLPNPYVNLFYATICLVIIFGLIKGLAK